MKPEFFGTFTQLITSTQGNPELLVLVLQALLKLLENADYKAIPEDTKFKSVLVSLSEGGTNKKVISLSTEIIDLLGFLLLFPFFFQCRAMFTHDGRGGAGSGVVDVYT
eukprot:TRINITY_DN5991_c0_g1_i16.p2 TRINITY_DN5991_c0_g1~~TRINITY_DN5991_c0_g1_i16.p2  ORF type:complete len:109 (-),score=27.51 TRINITY_DN5991_c0_g1_i16:43-369(-)